MFVSQLDGYGAQTGPCALPNASLDALPNSAISIAICWMCSTGPSTSFLSDRCFCLTVLAGLRDLCCIRPTLGVPGRQSLHSAVFLLFLSSTTKQILNLLSRWSLAL